VTPPTSLYGLALTFASPHYSIPRLLGEREGNNRLMQHAYVKQLMELE